MIAMGLGQGVQPLLGYCVGSGLWDRFKKVLKFSLCFSFSLSIVLTVLCYLFTNQIVSALLTDALCRVIFMDSSDNKRIVRRILCSHQRIAGNGRAVLSLIINVSRQGFIYIPAVFVLKAILGVTGLVWAQPAADILSIGIASFLYLKTSKQMMKELELKGAEQRT